ncbi:MAG TPA: peptidylprolyl isomerase [Gaiellaceae bacterium]|nr:peptidylprolyl isomerase [Gaiellaceae bacterium]
MLRTALAALVAALAVGAAAASASASSPPSLTNPSSLDAKAPAAYAVSFKTTKGTFVVAVHRAWAPKGADRFYNLVKAHFFDGTEFFRVLKGFVVQFGISGSPKLSAVWQNATIADDPVKTSNAAGTITFATAGPNTRTTQLFVNLANNAFLDKQGFAPFGKVTSGMAVVNKLYGGYGEAASNDQQQIAAQGNAFLKKHFPKLDAIVTARLAPTP